MPLHRRKKEMAATYQEGVIEAVKRRRRKLKWYVFATALASLAIVLAAFTIKNASVKRVYTEQLEIGMSAYAEGNYDLALSALRKATRARDTNECRLLMAECYIAQGNPDKALEVLRAGNTTDELISEKIIAIENRRADTEASDLVTVMGQSYPQRQSQFSLNNTVLSGTELEELLQLYALTVLELREDGLTDISALSHLGGLVTLDLANNRITDVSALSGLIELRQLCLDGNPISDVQCLSELTGLVSLRIENTQIPQEHIAALANALPNCAIQTNDANENDIIRIYFAGISFTETVEDLNLSERGIRTIDAVANCKSLKKLSAGENEISELSPLMDITGITDLDLHGNVISNLRPLMALDTISNLNLSNNLVATVTPLTGLKGLKQLDISDNPITDFTGLTGLSGLQVLRMDNTMLTDADLPELYGLKNLTSLSLCDNPELSGEAVEELKRRLPNCNIKTSTLVYMVQLGEESYRDDITELDVSGLGLKDIEAIAQFKALETIDLSSNGIRDIYQLQSQPSVTKLNLADNCIEDITVLTSLVNLEYLDLSNNYVSMTGTLINLRNLKELYIGGNPLTEAKIQELRSYLPDCVIYTELPK